ncbi:hypothetical protein Cs7R123_55780 [Catellatospora sp. TT07R-123]|uniref:hypothetical protein n=1 Tax=Catellatospora sp. TT07R-123 TaxID=2733863 RepID=UPI001B11431D|nr:hypothetical protein [Catellatospora sp. TT07R-123]GHJ48236.1 hypothetical protein Cs7R123_55780 [Catellatospora sp. TT07R-123]
MSIEDSLSAGAGVISALAAAAGAVVGVVELARRRTPAQQPSTTTPDLAVSPPAAGSRRGPMASLAVLLGALGCAIYAFGSLLPAVGPDDPDDVGQVLGLAMLAVAVPGAILGLVGAVVYTAKGRIRVAMIALLGLLLSVGPYAWAVASGNY